MKLTLLSVSLSAIILSSTLGLAATTSFRTERYLDIIDSMDEGYKHVLDDLTGMMELALKFRDDPDYVYDPSDMDRIVMQDGHNGTQELIDLLNEFINTTESDIEALRNEINNTDADIDGDGLSNQVENSLGSDPWNWDTDGDSLSDGLEYVMNAGTSAMVAPFPQTLIGGAAAGYILAKKRLDGKQNHI